ncbi:MAG: sigma-70 family RNA polymerase sigma factor [Bacteroidota bacterium]
MTSSPRNALPDDATRSKVAEGANVARPAKLAKPEGPIPATVRGARNGDPRAVRDFLEGIAPWVRRTCVAVLGPSHADLEDTMQESLFAALKALPSYRFEGDIRHYVTKISMRIAIANRRSSAARWQQHASIAAEQAAERPLAVRETWTAQELELVRRILDQLTGVQSEALFLRIVLGFSVEEIGAMTGVSPNTVKTRLRLGKNALRGDGKKLPFWRTWLAEKRK